jgi:small-conductance mechanosensitive channel
LTALAREIEKQILPDGGHISRSPEQQLEAFRVLLLVQQTLDLCARETQPALRSALDRMAPMVRFFRLGDGGVSTFNGGRESDGRYVDALLESVDAPGKPFGHAPHCGFQRFAAGRSIVLLDVGTPPPGAFATAAHGGALSFEMSTGAQRLIVNCGPALNDDEEWSAALRATAAHSTLTLAESSSATLLPSGRLRRLLGPRLVATGTVETRRHESAEGLQVDASHDLYLARFGLVHQRRLVLARHGRSLSGIDRLSVAGPGSGRKRKTAFAIRFHIHPDIRLSLAQGGGSVILKLPTGEGWRFRCGGGSLSVEESVYLGGGVLRRTEQLVVAGHIRDEDVECAWLLEQVGAFFRLLELWLNAALDRLQSVQFLFQVAILAGTALAALVLAPFVLRLAKRLLISILSRDWVASICNVVESILLPGLWLLFLWLIASSAGRSGFPVAVLDAAISLLTAFVVIRLLSHVVQHRLWQRVIFVGAFTLAALDILGLLAQIEASLASVGFSYGNIRISALNVVRALIVFAILLWLMLLLSSFLERRIVRAKSLSPSLQALFVQLLKLLFPVLAVLAALPVLGIDLTALTIFGGALAVGIGLGLQKTVANLISGLSLIAGGSIEPGDVIAVKDTAGNPTYGRVTSIGARYVSLRTRNGTEHLIANDDLLTHGLENWSLTDDRLRVKVPFGVSYDSDPRKVIELALDAAAGVQRVLKNPKPVCLLTEFDDFSMNFELRVWIEDPMNGVTNIRSECLLGLWDRFKANGIKIPFPRHDVRLIPLDGEEPGTQPQAEP